MMTDREKVIKALENAEEISEGTLIMSDQFRDVLIALLKEQEAVVRCKDCKHRGISEKCVLSAISEEKDFPLFILDNRGEWFCADGERKEGR